MPWEFRQIRNKIHIFLIPTIWLIGILFGLFGLSAYSHTASQSAVVSANSNFWPKESTLPRPTRPMLLLFAHPRCACSRASLAELERLMPALLGKIDVRILFIVPHGQSLEWAKQDLWDQSKLIPGIDVSLDVNGREAQIFGAKTSGQSFLFSNTGEKIFSGGLTVSRGHMGDSIGRMALLDFVKTGKLTSLHSPVFGCALQNVEPETLSD
jgi:hypothetical protein